MVKLSITMFEKHGSPLSRGKYACKTIKLIYNSIRIPITIELRHHSHCQCEFIFFLELKRGRADVPHS